MYKINKSYYLENLDIDRWTIAKGQEIAREYSPDHSECRIIAAKIPSGKIDSFIEAEKALAKQNRYSLEWKVYEHDTHEYLNERLLSARFKAQEEECVLVFPLDKLKSSEFEKISLTNETKIQRVHDENGLEKVVEISLEIGRRGVNEEKIKLAEILKTAPNDLSVYLLSVNGEAISCGRIHFPANSIYAEFAGGRTKTTYRRNGLFSALVAYRLNEAANRGRSAVIVDALPTSEPIFRRIGFQLLTRTQAYLYEPFCK